MRSRLTTGLLAIALGGLAASSQGQSEWDQPSTLGSYRPVTTTRSDYLETVPGPLPGANWNTPQPNAGASVVQTPPPGSTMNYGPAYSPAGAGNMIPGCASCAGPANGYQTGCDSCGSPAGRIGNRESGSRHGSRFGSRLLNTGTSGLDCVDVPRNRDSTLVAGVSALVFYRDMEDDLGLSYNSTPQSLFSTDSDPGSMVGLEASLGKRNCNGFGWDASFWTLNPSRSWASIGSSPVTALGGLSGVDYVPASSSVLDIFNYADTHQVSRTNDISSLQFNVLRNGGTLSNGCANFELFGGFRWFQFDEAMQYSAYSSYPGHPAQFNYDSCVENTLLGTQFGGRVERCISGRLRLATGLTLGVFNNSIQHCQAMYDEATGTSGQINTGPSNGRPYSYASQKNDISMLGEMNVMGYYMLSRTLRLGVGYRVLGVSGIALAPDQIPYNFTDAADIQRIDSNGSLILHGAHFGIQKCF